MTLKEYCCCSNRTRVHLIDRNCTLLYQCWFLFYGYFSYHLHFLIQLNNINLKLKTVHGDSGHRSKSCCTRVPTYGVKKTKQTIPFTLYLSQIIVDVHDYPKLKDCVSFRTTFVFLSECFIKGDNNSHRSHSLSACSVLSNKQLQTHWCKFHSWNGLLYELLSWIRVQYLCVINAATLLVHSVSGLGWRDEARTQWCRRWDLFIIKINKTKLPRRGKTGQLARQDKTGNIWWRTGTGLLLVFLWRFGKPTKKVHYRHLLIWSVECT